MTSLRTDIEKALNELISNEEGMRFQGLAVVLAKQKWPEFIACERKKDLGLDAHMPALLAPDRVGKGLASSVTATLGKIKDDAKKVQKHFDDVKVLIFATPVPLTNQKVKPWVKAIHEAYGYELIVISREDIITDLMRPSSAMICRTHLNIPVPIEPPVEEPLQKAREAASRVVTAWLGHPRLIGRPKIELQAVKLDQEGRDTAEVLGLAGFQAALLEGRRIVLEAPAGRGKTTTLVQLAERLVARGELAFVIDLPAWVASRCDPLEFIAKNPAFQSFAIEAKDLARLYEYAHFSFLLNGWNEITAGYSEEAIRALAGLERNFPKAGIIVATRTHYIRPPLPGSFRARLRPLSRKQRAKYLQQVLGNRADELGSRLDTDRVLDDLTRTPLFLAGVATIFLSGDPIPKTRLNVLGSLKRLVAESEEHRDHLERQPLWSHSEDYLTELAVHMTNRGGVSIDETPARGIIHSVGLRLNANGQIATLPEPAEVLSSLCAHHILERIDYPSVGFRFEHQQFQEFYAAVELKRQLLDLVGRDNPEENRRFTGEYVNKPIWEEPLCMVAEGIGELSAEPTRLANAVAAGRQLIELALVIDPVFAADLSRLCGSAVWRQVRGVVGERLRSWYRVANEHHQRCALAGMLATGSEDFVDIVLPLLTSDDQQVRLRSYRAWGEFHVSTLGRDWRDVVKGWMEEHRADFVGELVRERWMADIAEEFARTDPSPKARAAALRGLRWVGADDALVRVLTAFDDEAFEEVLRDRVLDAVPVELRPRAVAAYERLLQKQEDPPERLRIRLAAGEVGGERVSEGVQEELARWPAGKVDDNQQWLLKSALELVRKSDPEWVSLWVASRIADGSLWSDHWIAFVSSIPEDFKRKLLDRLSGEDVEQTDGRGIVPVLAATADADLAGEVFSRLRKLRSEISIGGDEIAGTRWPIWRQLEGLFQTMPPNIAVSGMLNHLLPTFDAVECEVVVELFGRGGGEDSDLRGQVEEDLRQILRKYLKDRLPFALSQDDFRGHLKAYLAVALARVGDPEDMADLHRLIRADIERLKRGREARLRGERGPLADGATTGWSTWHARALTWLDATRAEEVLLAVLHEAEYEQEAAAALVRLARIQKPEERLLFKASNYRLIWDARSGRHPGGFDEDRRRRYAIAIKQRIYTIMEERAKSVNPDSFNARLKELAQRVATLDSRDSAEAVMQIMALPGEWDGWIRVEALEALLFGGARLGATAALGVLNPTISHTQSRFWEQQAYSLLRRCLCLLPFLNPPSTGIGRIREVLATTHFPRYELRDVLTALGHSRCHDAFRFLLELATANRSGFKSLAGEWMNAMAALESLESKRVLLSFVDPDVEQLGLEPHLEHHDRERLASHIVEIARADLAIPDRLYLLCTRQLQPSMRLMLAEVVTRLRTVGAMVVGLDLMHDDAKPPIPGELLRGVESVFIEHRPYGDTGDVYTLVPRSANEIRSRLFEMVLNDDNRRRSAWALLGQIESWRLEYGRPTNEPRHPAFDSGEPWPPTQLGRFDLSQSSGQEE